MLKYCYGEMIKPQIGETLSICLLAQNRWARAIQVSTRTSAPSVLKFV